MHLEGNLRLGTCLRHGDFLESYCSLLYCTRKSQMDKVKHVSEFALASSLCRNKYLRSAFCMAIPCIESHEQMYSRSVQLTCTAEHYTISGEHHFTFCFALVNFAISATSFIFLKYVYFT